MGGRPARRWAVLGSLALLPVAVIVLGDLLAVRSPQHPLLREDGVAEWAQAIALLVLAVGAGRAARRHHGTARWLLAGAAVLLVAAIGEELAWGSRLLDVEGTAIQAANEQGDLTLHNLPGGLELTFVAMLGVALAAAVTDVATGGTRATPWLATWFAVPAGYALVRLLDTTPSTHLAKTGELVELVLLVAVGLLGRRVLRASAAGELDLAAVGARFRGIVGRHATP